MRVSTKDFITMVEAFMRKHGQVVRSYPEFPTREEQSLRLNLIREESVETCLAISTGSLNDIADGLADLLYVTIGTALTYGIPLETIFSEVHRSNMTKPKLGHDNMGNKVQKGDYSKPQIATLIQQAINMGKKNDKV